MPSEGGGEAAGSPSMFSSMNPHRWPQSVQPEGLAIGVDATASAVLSAARFKGHAGGKGVQAGEEDAEASPVPTTEERWKQKMQERKEKGVGASVHQRALKQRQAQGTPRSSVDEGSEEGEPSSRARQWREKMQQEDGGGGKSMFGTQVFSSVFGTFSARRGSAEGAERTPKKTPKLRGKMMAVRALAKHHGEVSEEEEEEEKPKESLAQIIKKNQWKLHTFAAMESTSEQAGEIIVPGVQLGDVPLNLDGRGLSASDRARGMATKMWVLNEQLAQVKKWGSSVSFFVTFFLFTAAVFSAFPPESILLQERDLMATLSMGGLKLGGAQAFDSLHNVSTLEDVYAWLKGPLIDAAFPNSSVYYSDSFDVNIADSSGYNATNATNSSDPEAERPLGRLIGKYNLLLSPVRMRQIRVRADTCSIPTEVWLRPGQTLDDMIMTAETAASNNLFNRDLSLQSYIYDCSLNLPAPAGNGGCGMVQETAGDWYSNYPRGQVGTIAGCYDDLDTFTEARSVYGPIETNESLPNFNNSLWGWLSASSLNEEGRYGREGAFYSGGGYVLDLAHTREEAVNQTRDMEEGVWLDLSSRAVFVSFVAFNPNVDILTRVVVSIELPKSSGAITWVRATSIHASDVDVQKAEGLALQSITLVAVVAHILWEAFEMCRKGFQYLEEPHHFQDLAFDIIYIVGFIARTSIIRVSSFPPAPESVASFDLTGAAWAMYLWRACLAFDCVLIYGRFLRNTAILPPLYRLYKMLNRALDVIVAALLIITSAVIAFAAAFHLAFGQELREYRSFASSMFTTFRMVRGGFRYLNNWDSLWAQNRLLGPLFFTAWSFIGNMAVVAMFAAMLWSALRDIAMEHPAETIQQWVARLVKHYLREKERKKELIEVAMQSHKKKEDRNALKVEDSLGFAALKMRDLEEKRRKNVSAQTSAKSPAKVFKSPSRPPDTPKSPAPEKTSYWTRLLMELAGFDVDESVEERVQVSHRRLNQIDDTIGEVDGVVSMLSHMMREVTDNEMASLSVLTPFQLLMQSAPKGREKPQGGQVAGSVSNKDKSRKKKHKEVPSGKPFLELKTKTTHVKAANEEEGREGEKRKEHKHQESTLLDFRAVDAAGAQAIRDIQSRSNRIAR